MTGAQYVIVWEFRVRQEKAAEFVQKYGPEGAWARFFRGSAGYIKTELVRDVTSDFRFLTLDYWQTEEEFSRFQQQHLAEYQRLDKEFEGLTETETRLGAFWTQHFTADERG
ncbi:MAG TPA: antibiotic biosynthesis monooxygenase [Candidatus Angelobacter sp.]|nr:antibiotic biosynthesis monooxygenase [Candidatus Angelobacter sp.]